MVERWGGLLWPPVAGGRFDGPRTGRRRIVPAAMSLQSPYLNALTQSFAKRVQRSASLQIHSIAYINALVTDDFHRMLVWQPTTGSTT